MTSKFLLKCGVIKPDGQIDHDRFVAFNWIFYSSISGIYDDSSDLFTLTLAHKIKTRFGDLLPAGPLGVDQVVFADSEQHYVEWVAFNSYDNSETLAVFNHLTRISDEPLRIFLRLPRIPPRPAPAAAATGLSCLSSSECCEQVVPLGLEIEQFQQQSR